MSKSLATCLLLFAYCAQAVASPLPRDLGALIDGFNVPRDHLGLYIAPLEGPGAAITLNPVRPLNPASVIKLLPTLAALELFTPAHRWTTDVYADGEVSGGVLNGNLYIRGGGDPYFTAESAWTLFRNVRAHGIARIAGDIVVDEGVFDLPGHDRAAFDDKPYRLYNGPPGGLMLNFWGVRFTVKALADRVHIDAFPGSPDLKIVNQVAHSTAPCTRGRRVVGLRIDESPGAVTVTFSGRLSSQCSPVVINRAAVPPERYLAYMLPGLWRDAGGALDGRVRRGAVPDGAIRLFGHESRSLAEAVRATNKFSNNMMARHLLLALGARYRDREIEISDGINTLYNWMSDRGIDIPGLNIVNGSGLSRDTRISAVGLANLLRAGAGSRYAPEFLSSLPVAGEDWALESRAFAGETPRAVRLKTGLIDHVRAMAGYVPARDGRTWIVVLLINHAGAHQGLGTRIQNAVVRYVMGL